MRHLLLPFLLVAGGSGCRQDVNVSAVRHIIEANNANVERWYAAGAVDSLVTLLAEDVWQFPPNSPALVGRDSVRRFWTAALTWGRWHFDFSTQDLVVSDSLAVERGRYTLQFTANSKAPFPSMADTGNYVVLWRREADGIWRGVWDAPVSTRLPAAPPTRSGRRKCSATARGGVCTAPTPRRNRSRPARSRRRNLSRSRTRSLSRDNGSTTGAGRQCG
jgi:ketosteroid isomerase-like protein